MSYSTYYGNEGASLSAGDVEHYVTIKKLLPKFIFNIHSALIWWAIQAYARYDIVSFAEQMDLITAQRPDKSIK
jgi:hypothetical protein